MVLELLADANCIFCGRCSCDVVVCTYETCDIVVSVLLFKAEDGIRDLVRSRGLGDVYKRQFTYRWPGRGFRTPGRFRLLNPGRWPAGPGKRRALSLIHI